MLHSDPYRSHFEGCNTTELYQLCRKAGIAVPPDAPREKLIDFLLGDDRPHIDHPIDSLRNGLIGLIQDHWVMIEPQLTCPAKELGPPAGPEDPPKPEPSNPSAPLACYRCEDTKVISCLVQNEQYENLIQLRRTPNAKEEDTTMSTAMGVVTVQTAPRDPAELVKLPRFMLKRLATDLNLFQNDQQKIAFIDAASDVQAQTLATALKQIDAGGGAPAQAAAPAVTQTTAAPTQVPTEAQTPARTPRNNGVTKKAEGGADGSDAVQALLAAVKATNEQLEKLMKHALQVENIHTTQHQTLLQAVADLGGVTKICLGACIVLAENTISMPAKDLLTEAEEAVGRLSLGKTAGKG